jgi:putative endopeptidase
MPLHQVQDLTPDWNWSDYFKDLNVLAPSDINVQQPEFFKTANDVFKSTPMEDWKAYLCWHLITEAAAELSNDFVNENLNFNERILHGTEQIKPAMEARSRFDKRSDR